MSNELAGFVEGWMQGVTDCYIPGSRLEPMTKD